eukprot:TRINITY_DN29748_c0_g1_i1.p1 TRINITY_DN29748_c0_g1~~TRINITY_DN29748_c0_g1_i1.p1  ORF type:complete len:299 (-),score=24.16 TRINITY_DN29748_c0_g1_i1:109-1005(-)
MTDMENPVLKIILLSWNGTYFVLHTLFSYLLSPVQWLLNVTGLYTPRYHIKETHGSISRRGTGSFRSTRGSGKSKGSSTWGTVSLFNELSPSAQPRVRKTLVLDLDETLVHSTTKRQTIDTSDCHIHVVINNAMQTYFVYKRPYLDIFLHEVCKWYDVVIFTASLQRYADPVIDHIDREQRVKKRYFRSHCTQVGEAFIKDITKLGQHPKHTIIIDNSPVAYSYNQDVALPIKGWYNDNDDDTELLDMLPFLEALRFCQDVRSILSLRCQPLTSGNGPTNKSSRPDSSPCEQTRQQYS